MNDKVLGAISIKSDLKESIIISNISFSLPNSDLFFETKGLWDTGASNSVISQNVVDALGLKPTGVVNVNTASNRNLETYLYFLDLVIQGMNFRIKVNPSLGILSEDIDCLIGMDIICLGDFAITHFMEKTTMSFRIPSLHTIDYLLD